MSDDHFNYKLAEADAWDDAHPCGVERCRWPALVRERELIPVADVEAAIQRVTDALATWSDFQQIDNWVAFCNGHKHALDGLRSEVGL